LYRTRSMSLPATSPSISSEPLIAHGETVLARLALDLDGELHFARGAVVLSGERLLARNGDGSAWQEWPLRAGLALRHHDHAGVGTLELHDEHARLAGWRFTLAHHAEALQLVAQ